MPRLPSRRSGRPSPRTPSAPFPAPTPLLLPLLFTLLGLLALLGGCGILDPDPFRELERDLDRARARWAAAGPEDYRMVYQRGCFCVYEVVRPVEIEVRGGVARERRYADTGEPVPEAFRSLFLTVPELFQAVEEAIRARAASLQAEYDPHLGYPVEVSIDPRLEVADDEVVHRILELGSLPGGLAPARPGRPDRAPGVIVGSFEERPSMGTAAARGAHARERRWGMGRGGRIR
jgi:hypothetical protein